MQRSPLFMRYNPGCHIYQSNMGLKLIAANDWNSLIYTFATDAWASGPPLPSYFRGGASVLYHDTFLMVARGNIIELNCEEETFSTWTKTMPSERTFHNVILVTNEDLKCD